MLITRGTRDETFFYVSKKREKRMHEIITNEKEELLNYKIKEEQSKLF